MILIPHKSGFGLFLLLSIFILATASLSAAPVLEVEIGKVACWKGQENVVIPVYVRNYSDSIAGFELLLRLDRSDIASFTIDSLDTAGTLLSQYHWSGYSLRNYGDGAKISAASIFKAIAPQSGTIPLFNILTHAGSLADTSSERITSLYISCQTLDNFGFSRTNGTLIGTITESIVDTNYYNCIEWYEGECLTYEQVYEPPADSTRIDTIMVARIDTALTKIIDGSISIRPCGDANGDNKTNLRDISFIINHLYRLGPAPVPSQAGDVDKNGTINLLDVSGIIDFLYRGGASLGCLEIP